MPAVVRRRGLLVVLVTLLVAALSLVVANLRPVTYRADSVLLVPSGAQGAGPGQANEALRLASTYATLIPRDNGVLQALSTALSVPRGLAGRGLSVTTLGDTALLDLRYTADTPDVAVVGSRTVAQTIIEGRDTSDTVPRSSVRLVSLASRESVVASGGRSATTLPIGLLLGLALALVLATAAERSDRRLDRVRDVSTVLDVPGLDLGEAGPERQAAFVRRWAELSGDGRRTVVSVEGMGVPAARVEEVCSRLAETARGASVPATSLGDSASGGTEQDEGVLLVPRSAHGAGSAARRQDAQVRVLLVPRGSRRRALSRWLVEARQLGERTPDFLLLVPARLVRDRA